MTTIDAFPETRVDPGNDADRRYTTRQTMDLCMRLADVTAWDLDVAADAESHWAPRWYGVEQDGLKQPWDAERIWCNPPYSDIEPWLCKAWAVYGDETLDDFEVLAMLLPANRTEQPWWQRWVEPWRDGNRCGLTTHFLPSRVRYGHPGNPLGHGSGSPPFASVLLVWRRS